MKKVVFTLAIAFLASASNAQTVQDLFTHSDLPVVWLGIDYSHVQLVGDMSQFGGAGMKGVGEVRERYMPAWNRLILAESSKYDIAGMLRKDEVEYDIDMIMAVNATVPLENMEKTKANVYSEEDLKRFVESYDVHDKNGIGILLIAESLNKFHEEAAYHFVAISLPSKTLLFHDKLLGKPRGFGLRNYWGGSIYDVVKQIKRSKYRVWKKQVQAE